jgi:uracil-DNA glycosylase
MMEESSGWIHLARSYLHYQVNMGFTEVALPRADETRSQQSPLEAIRAELGECTRCLLHEKRLNIVFGEGNPHARLVFVGEGPGEDEDEQGRPFVGRAGQLLSRMIRAMNLDRFDVYIANIVKCRPPGNRPPHRREIETCLPFLESQIAAVNPAVIVALGKVAACALLGTDEPVSRMRGRFHDRKGIPVMPTYHPSFLLREEPDRKHKAEAWADLKEVMALLELPMPGSGDQP